MADGGGIEPPSPFGGRGLATRRITALPPIRFLGDRVGVEPTTSRFEAGDCAISASGRSVWLTRQDSNLQPPASQAGTDPFSFGSLVLGERFELPCRAV